jgi:hypothetical protein
VRQAEPAKLHNETLASNMLLSQQVVAASSMFDPGSNSSCFLWILLQEHIAYSTAATQRKHL